MHAHRVEPLSCQVGLLRPQATALVDVHLTTPWMACPDCCGWPSVAPGWLSFLLLLIRSSLGARVIAVEGNTICTAIPSDASFSAVEKMSREYRCEPPPEFPPDFALLGHWSPSFGSYHLSSFLSLRTLKITGGCKCTYPSIHFRCACTLNTRKLARMLDSSQEQTGTDRHNQTQTGTDRRRQAYTDTDGHTQTQTNTETHRNTIWKTKNRLFPQKNTHTHANKTLRTTAQNIQK